MKEQIIKFLQDNTSKDNCWIYWQTLYHAIVEGDWVYDYPITSDEMDEDFQVAMETLIANKVIRADMVVDNIFRFALESIIEEHLNDVKLNNITELEFEVQQQVVKGDYEEAEEYRSILRDAKLEILSVDIEDLKEQLEIAVSVEDYKKAAHYRDEILKHDKT